MSLSIIYCVLLASCLSLFWKLTTHTFSCICVYFSHQLIKNFCFFIFYLFEDFIYLFLDREEGRKKERERNINVWLPLAHPHRGPGLQPRHGTQSTEPHQPGQFIGKFWYLHITRDVISGLGSSQYSILKSTRFSFLSPFWLGMSKGHSEFIEIKHKQNIEHIISEDL